MTTEDPLSQPVEPVRVAYATGRMLSVDDFQAEQTYHRGRLARVLTQTIGTGTVYGLKVKTNDATDPKLIELVVTAGLAVDRRGRLIDVQHDVCILLDAFLKNASDDVIGRAFKGSANPSAILADVFATFVPSERGKAPAFGGVDDYDATDAFVADRLLDGFAVQLVLRVEDAPKLPQDPWQVASAPGQALKQQLLDANAGPNAAAPVEYPNDPFDRSSVFLARVSVTATRAGTARPVYDLTKLTIDNLSRLFLFPAALVARSAGLTQGG
jgi:hypothetical protein